MTFSNSIPRWVYLLIVVASIVVIISALIRVFTPFAPITPTEYLATNLDGTRTTFQNFEFEGNAPTFPNKLALGQADTQIGFETQIINKIVTENELKPNESVKNIWNNEKNELLTKNQYTSEYSFLPKSPILPATATLQSKKTEPELITISQTFINNFFAGTALTANADQIRYLLAQADETATSFDKAELVIVPFSPQLNGIPVFFNKTSQPPLEVAISKSGAIINLQFYPTFATVTADKMYDRIDVLEAVKNINGGLGSVVGASLASGPENLDLADLQNGRLTSVRLEYRPDPQTQQLIPFYRFAGTAQNLRKSQLNVEIITPAVAITK